MCLISPKSTGTVPRGFPGIDVGIRGVERLRTFLNGRDISKQGVTKLPAGAEIRTGDTVWTLIDDEWVLICTESVAVFGPSSQQVSYAAITVVRLSLGCFM